MCVRRGHAIEIALLDNHAIVDDQKPVRVRLFEHGGEIERAASILEGEAVEIPPVSG